MDRTEEDPIARIRRARHEISAKCGYDARRLVEHYQERQKAHADRLIAAAAPAEEPETPHGTPNRPNAAARG